MAAAHWSVELQSPHRPQQRRLLGSSPARIARPPVQERRPREPLLTARAPSLLPRGASFWASVQIRVFIGARVRDDTPLANSRFARASAGLINELNMPGGRPAGSGKAKRRQQTSAASAAHSKAATAAAAASTSSATAEPEPAAEPAAPSASAAAESAAYGSPALATLAAVACGAAGPAATTVAVAQACSPLPAAGHMPSMATQARASIRRLSSRQD